MATIRQIARLAGFSICTVSKALRDDPEVHPETRARIRAIAEQLHYRPNRLVQGLYRGKSRMLGVLLPDVIFDYYAHLLSGILAEAYCESYRVVIFEHHYNNPVFRESMALFTEQRIEGVILIPGTLVIPRQALFELFSNNIMPVGIDVVKSEMPIDLIHTDEDALALAAVEYLMSLGHRAIAFLGIIGCREGRAMAVDRALRRHHLPTEYYFEQAVGPFTPESVSPIVDAMLALPSPPTAAIAWNDNLAMVLIQQFTRRGLRIPQDFSVLGCGNMELDAVAQPPITSIEQHPDLAGRTAVRLLLQRINEGWSSDSYQPVTYATPFHIVTRASCAPPLCKNERS